MFTKKSLGQHWLRSESARAAIIKAAKLSPIDVVLEIGPGEGFLTEALLATGAKVVAVEKDARLIAPLTAKFQSAIAIGQLELIPGDILNLKPKPYTPRLAVGQVKPSNWKLIASIPYYLTGAILKKFLAGANQPSRAVLLLQKEVVRRIVARDGRESILSISVKAFGQPKQIKTVPAGAFAPAPKVDSTILLIENISRRNFAEPESERQFFAVLKRGFAHKRKLLRRNLDCEAVRRGGLIAAGIAPNARAENVTLEQWLRLSRKFYF